MSVVSSIGTCSDRYDEMIPVKWNNNNVFYRFSLFVTSSMNDLMHNVRLNDPNFDDFLNYIDEEGDKIQLTTTMGLQEALRAAAKSYPFATVRLVTVKRDDIKPNVHAATSTDEIVVFPQHKERIIPKLRHHGVTCDACDFPVFGIRYQCIKCDDYDLCGRCEKTGMHPEHPMIRFATERTVKPAYIELYRHGVFNEFPEKNPNPFTQVDSTVDNAYQPHPIQSFESENAMNNALKFVIRATQEITQSVNDILNLEIPNSNTQQLSCFERCPQEYDPNQKDVTSHSESSELAPAFNPSESFVLLIDDVDSRRGHRRSTSPRLSISSDFDVISMTDENEAY